MFKTLPLTVLSFLTGMGMLAAQISFSVPDRETCGTTVSVPVVVTGFNSITAFSYSMEWDETVLDFDSVGAYNLDYLGVGDFGTSQVSNGILTTAWIDDDGTGKTRINGTEIYRIYFTVIGPISSTSSIQFEDIPTPIIAATGFPPVALTVTTNDGSITYDDNTPPTLTCPVSVTVNTAGTTSIVNGIAPTVLDNCSLTSVSYSSTGATSISGMNNASGNTFNLGTTTVNYLATDGQGNTSNCSFAVNVNQVLDDVFFTALNDAANCADTVISIAVTTDNFDDITAFSFSLLWEESVIDYSSLTFPPPVLQHLDASDFGLAQVNNGILTLAWIDNDGSGETLADGDTLFIINFDVVGSPGDESLVEFSDTPTDIIAAQGFPPVSLDVITVDGNAVIVDDPPIISNCPANIVLNNAPGTCGRVVTWTAPTATDDCDNPDPVPVQTVGLPSGSTFPVGTTTITYIATDSQSRKDTCTFTITINDTEAPTIACPATVTVAANSNCVATGVNLGIPTAADNCGVNSLMNNAVATFPIGTTTVTWTVTDVNGNSNTCQQTVTVTDNTLPTITCPGVVGAFANSNCVATGITLGTPTTADNCGVNSTTNNAPATFPVGTTTVTWTVTDVNGNSNTCQQMVIVTDNTPPSITCPSAVSVSTNSNCVATGIALGTPTTTDNCGVNPATNNAPAAFPVGITTFTWMVTDVNGNSSTCQQTVTVADNTPPTITCPTAVSVFANSNCVATGVSLGTPTPADNCGVNSVSNNAPASFPLGTNTVTWTVTDVNGNSNTCQQTVTVVDNAPPTITCPAAVSAVANGNCEATGLALGTPTTTDNCGVNPATNNAPATFPVGTTTVTWTVTDLGGNSSTCQQIVTVTDNIPPTITCPAALAIGTDANSCEATNVSLGNPVTDDNCSVNPATNDAPAAFQLGATSVTWTVTDPSGNSSTCQQLVTVTDDDGPSIVCPPAQSLTTNADCEATLGDYTTLAVVSDNCTNAANIAISQFPLPGTIINDTIEVRLIATDGIGLSDTCFFNVNFVDNILPAFSFCPPDSTLAADAGECFATLVLPSAVAFDSCGIASLTANGPASDEFPIGTTIVTYTATDANGNIATCLTSITVLDTIPPVMLCQNATIYLDAAGNATLNIADIDDGSDDPCGLDNQTLSQTLFSCGDLGVNSVTLTVEDDNGNTSTCTASVTVLDTFPPVLDCVGDVDILVPAGTVDTVISNIALLAISDNCGIDTSYYHFSGAIASGGGNGTNSSGTAFPVGTTTVTYFGEDADSVSSCSFDVTVVEDAVSVVTLTCSNDQASPNIPGSCFATMNGVTATATPSNLVASSFFTITGATTDSGLGLDASGDFNVGTSTVTFFVVTTSNDTLSCPVIIKVLDTQAPAFTNCPAGNVTVNNTPDQCGFVFTGNLTATDNCPGVNISYNVSSGSLLPIGVSNVTANATDASSNNIACSYTITVVDNQAPQIVNCQNGSTIEVSNDPDECGAVVTWSAVTATDNCGTVQTFTVTPLTSGDFFPLGTTTVTYTAEDDAGNTATCEIDVIVADDQAPSLVCPGNQPPVNADANQCAATVNFPAPVADDNCGPLTPIATTPIGPVFNVGVHTVAYSVTDGAGNVTTCSFTVTVVDNVFPTIPDMPADFIVDTDPGECGAIVTWDLPSFPTDNCGIDAFTSIGGSPGDFFSTGTHEIQYVAEDVNGNTTIETLTFIVEDDTPPTLDCPAGATISVDGSSEVDPDNVIISFQQMDCDNIQLFLAELIPTDACGMSAFVQTGGLPSGSAFPIGQTTIAYLATDNNGNQTTCSYVINVLDLQIAPASVSNSEVCEGGSVTFTVGGMQGASFLWTDGNNNTVSSQQTFTLTNVSLSQGGTYTAYVSMAFCDVESTVDLDVNPRPVVTIDANDILCASSNVPLSLTATNSSSATVDNNGWVWTYPGGATMVGQNQSIPNPTVANSGTYTVVATSTLGCTGSASENVQISTGPPTPTLFGTTANACTNEEIFLNGQPYSGNNVTYHWFASPATGSGLTPINNFIVAIEPSVADTFTYYFYVTVDGCDSDTAEWVVNVGAYPVIDLDVIGETLCVNGGSNVTLIDNGTGADEWNWAGPFGPLSGSTSSVVLQNVNPSFTGLYTVTATTDNGCESSASTTLTFTSAPTPLTPTLTASANPICEGGIVTLTGTSYANVDNYIWTGNSLPLNSEDLSEIDALPAGTGNFDYTFAAIVNGCPTDTVTVTIVVETLPAVDIIVTGELNCVDGNSPVTLSTNAQGIATYTWTDSGGNVLSNAATLPLNNVTASNSGTYYLDVVTAGSGCLGFGSVTLDITNGIDGLTANATTEGCEDGELHFEASTIAGATYQWVTPSNVQFSTNQNPTILNAQSTGSGTYTVTANLNGCTDVATVDVELLGNIDATNGIVEVTVSTAQEFDMSAFTNFNYGDYVINILQQPLNGSVTLTHDSIYTYKPDGGFWGSDNMIVEFCNVNCPGLCDIAKITFVINYPPGECIITTVISPNGDGANDEMIVSCAEANLLNTLVIFNQWGDKVYEASPYENDWKGTHDERDLPDGTYFYIFQRDPDTAAEKGFVMIYR